MRPKCDPRRTKIEDKNEVEKRCSCDRLGAVLGRSWLILGVVLGSFLLILYWFLYYFVTNEVFEKVRCQEATWADLEPVWGAKRLKMRPAEGPKMR